MKNVDDRSPGDAAAPTSYHQCWPPGSRETAWHVGQNSASFGAMMNTSPISHVESGIWGIRPVWYLEQLTPDVILALNTRY
jgi:hypothetical protein